MFAYHIYEYHFMLLAHNIQSICQCVRAAKNITFHYIYYLYILVGVKVFSLTDYFRVGRYQNSHRYTRFRIQMKEQILAMSKVGGMIAKN